jgi:hypothetical protein
MAVDAPTKLDGLTSLLDTSAEQLAAAALLAITAVGKAWQTYNDRPGTKRGGRRASDPDCVAMANSAARIEQELAQLRLAITGLTERVAALEPRREAPAA